MAQVDLGGGRDCPIPWTLGGGGPARQAPKLGLDSDPHYL